MAASIGDRYITNSPATGMTPLFKFQHALTKPLYQRCSEIEHIIEEASQKDLQNLFPLLVESIFGFNNQLGWGLRTIMRNYHQQDFAILQNFLSPRGPLFCMIYKLLSDSLLRYEFPISCLPAPTKQVLESGAIPPLYINKLQFHDQSRSRALLFLNALEYYIFHFAYFIISPQNNKAATNWYSSFDSLYTAVFNDYLYYFLPYDGTGVPPMPSNIHISPSRSPFSHFSFSNRSASNPLTRSCHTIGNYNFVSKSNSFKKNVPSPNLPAIDYSQNETWRSEVFVQVLAEFWLNQNSLDSNRLGLSKHSSESFLPSCDHMRVVRMLIRHIHFFVNSSSPVVAQSPTFLGHSPFNEFKRSVIPHIIQKKLYSFFRHGFDHWPLDSSFRLILEAWLSYIQPWRYSESNKSPSRTKDKDTYCLTMDPLWKQFIIDNLLFYTVIFQNFVPRLFRMDLTSPKNAHMLFRVVKVFNQTNLPEYVADGESALQEPLGKSSVFPSELYSSRSSPSSTAALLRLQFSELEGPGFIYSPLFSDKCKEQILQVLFVISKAETIAENINKSKESSNTGWLNWLGLGSFSEYSYLNGYDDFTFTDSKKLQFYLQQSFKFLCEMFKMEELKANSSWASLTSSCHSSLSDCSLTDKCSPDTKSGQNGPVLTPLGRYQLINGLAKFDLDYQGDPDLQPIRSFEVVFLVRLLYKMSVAINQKYSQQLGELYYRSDPLGWICKIFLQPPITIRVPSKASSTSPRIEKHLPPRISLRFLARHSIIVCFIICSLLIYIFNMGSVFLMFFFFLIITTGFILKHCSGVQS